MPVGEKIYSENELAESYLCDYIFPSIIRGIDSILSVNNYSGIKTPSFFMK